MLKLQVFVFAVAEVCIENLAKSPPVTTCTSIFFEKANKANQMHGTKNVLKSVFWVKVFRKLPIKIYDQNPCITAGPYPETFWGHRFFEIVIFPYRHHGCVGVKKLRVFNTSDPLKSYSVESNM